MVDFHSHMLPGIDDGADKLSASLLMLEESKKQGVDIVFLTPHFYADETNPERFLQYRDKIYEVTRQAISLNPLLYPEIHVGAEVLYYPGMSETEELASMTIEGTPFLLVEPPMAPWRESMLREIEAFGKNFGLIPVIAHVDRYMRLLKDYSLLGRIQKRKILAQVNASYFIHRDTSERALKDLHEKRFQFIGSDCHNMKDRAPNMGRAAQIIEKNRLSEDLSELNYRIYSLLGKA